MPDPTGVAVETHDLGRSYPGVEALAGVDLRVPAGSVLGVLGHNGAGKSTLVDILATRTLPTTGTARVCGYDVVRHGDQVRRRIGVASQGVALDEAISGRANLVLVGRLLGASRATAAGQADQMLAAFGLADAADRRPATYSGGMRRRLDLACSLLGRPRVLFLDEPSTGLDPVAKADVWTFVRGLAAQDVTVVLTTQDLDEAENLATDIVVLGQGKVVAAGTPAALKAGVGTRCAVLRLADAVVAGAGAALLTGAGLTAAAEGDALLVTVTDPADTARAARLLLDARFDVRDLTVRDPTLTDVYLALYRGATVAAPPTPPPVEATSETDGVPA